MGIKYDLNKTECWADNFKEKIITIKKLLGNWTLRNLSLQRKVIVLKSLALPILVQSLTVLPDPPLEIISEIQLEFFNFLWSGKSDKIKRNILIGDFSHGGYKHASYSVILSCSNVFLGEKTSRSIKSCWLEILVSRQSGEFGRRQISGCFQNPL